MLASLVVNHVENYINFTLISVNLISNRHHILHVLYIFHSFYMVDSVAFGGFF